MEDPTAKRIQSTGGGGGGDKPPFKLNPKAKEFTPVVKPPREQYVREFETVAQQQFNTVFAPFGLPRARSLSIGIYDPNTNQRTQRMHYHLDPMRPDSGNAIPKDDAEGRYGGAYTQYTSNPIKK
jgi:hypothetical protein